MRKRLKRIAMRTFITYTFILAGIFLIFGCSTPEYFHDTSSFERQKDLQNTRTANVFGEIFTGVSSVCMAVAFDGEVEYYPGAQQFKKIKLINPTTDTMYVNMLTDLYWDKDNYCDFMDIRIPPLEECKVLVPVNASYNLYFSPTPQSDDDEMLEIFTSDVLKRISLKPNMTLTTLEDKQK